MAPTLVELVVESALDAGRARRAARAAALSAGFSSADTEAIAIAASELATNLARYANRGRITIEEIERDGKRGLRLESEDEGPGIVDVPRAMSDGYSTGGGLGGGLGGVRRLMDEFDLQSAPSGTRVVAIKWWKR